MSSQLFVLMNQGELVQQIPEGVRLVNPRYAQVPVLEPKGKNLYGHDRCKMSASQSQL